MSKPKNTTADDATPGAAALLTENETPKQNTAVPLDDPSYFMPNYIAADESYQMGELRWKPGAPRDKFHARFFRLDEIAQNKRMIEADFFVQVKRDATIYGYPCEDLFEEDQFESDGLIGRKIDMKSDGDSWHVQYESLLFLQPIGAYHAKQAAIAAKSKERLNPDREKIREAQQLRAEASKVAGYKSGMIADVVSDTGDVDGDDDDGIYGVLRLG